MNFPNEFNIYLQPGLYADSNHPEVIAFAKNNAGPEQSQTEKAVSLYYAVRDEFRYDPYHVDMRPEALTASAVLARGSGFCVEKANLLSAAARVWGIPSRLGFANVRNHIGTEKIEQILRTDVLVFHGYTEMFLNGKWVKATPAFNRALCEKLGVHPLEFDGENDSVFQESNREGGRFMEYLHDYGQFAEIPRELMLTEFQRFYPHLFEKDTDLQGKNIFSFKE